MNHQILSLLLVSVVSIAGGSACRKKPSVDATGTGDASSAPSARATEEPPVLLKPASVAASTAIRAKGDDHPAEHAFDGDPKTAWNEAAPGPGRGEWIEATFAGAQRLKRIKLATGYVNISPKFGDLFPANAHLKKVSVLVDGRAVRTIDVAEDQRDVTVDLDETGKTLRFVADDVYEGKKWQDLCVSEIEVYGVPAAGATPQASATAATGTAKTEARSDEKPNEESLLAVFGSNLTSYGINSLSGRVNSEPKGHSMKGWVSKAPKTWTSATTWVNPFGAKIPVTATLIVTAIHVDTGDTDDFPYRGTVDWRCTGSSVSWCGERGRTGRATYDFASRSKKWRTADGMRR